jgi:translocation and assembly module TamA
LRYRLLTGAFCAFALMAPGLSVRAFDGVDFQVQGADDDLTDRLRDASLLLAAEADPVTDAQDLFAAARGEYARLVGALYASGRYSGVVRVLIDGREAAAIAPLDAPSRISRVQVIVDPGPVFTFSRATVAPLAPGTTLPDGFAASRVAESGLVQQAVTAGVDGWRNAGHAKAAPVGDRIVADHPSATLSAEVALDPGPRLRFGTLSVAGEDRMRVRRILKIAGLPEGEVYSPAALQRAADRLRRTGVFRSVTMEEAAGIRAPDLLDITAVVSEEKPRRLSFGAEVASFEGLNLSGAWLHRNLLGGAERFRIAAEVLNIGAQNSGMDWRVTTTLDRPATLTPDTSLGFNVDFGHLDEVDYAADFLQVGTTLTHVFSDTLTGRLGLEYEWIDGRDDLDRFRHRNLGLPVGLNWDRRNSKTDATAGFYLDAEVKPFVGFGTTDSGLRLAFDTRVYRGFGADDRVVLAGRLQGGALFGADLLDAPRNSLFYSGGGGTVRGQPFQSLGVTIPGNRLEPQTAGGTRFVAASVEARVRVTDSIGAVAFVDVGTVSDATFTRAGDDLHAGAGLGLRYLTGFGPIRLDVAAPVAGDTGDGVQVYVGIGQAF